MYDLIGKTLGKYQVIELTHQTAVTEVYKGFNPVMNRFVVVNVLKAEFTSNEAILKRFLEQNDIAAKVQHAHLAPLIDFGEENGIYYRVLVYGSGGDWLENKKWLNNSQAIVRLFAQLSAALDHIHRFGYAHLNLRPMNIFFNDQRQPMLGDFGIAVSPEFGETDPYSSPEIRRNEPVDHHADIYALGVLLYEILTGAPPDMNRYIPLRTHRPDLPQDVEKVIMKAMSDRPEDRFQSVNTFQSALVTAFQYSADIPSTAPAPVSQQPQKRTNWILALVIALIVLGLITLGALALIRPGSDAVEPPEVEVPVEPEQPAPPPDEPGPDVGGERPGIQWPDINLPDLSEIPFCNSLYPAAGLGVVGIVTMKAKRKNKPEDDDQQEKIILGKDNCIEDK